MSCKSNWEPPEGMASVLPPDRRWQYLANTVRNRGNHQIPNDDTCVTAAYWFCRSLTERPPPTRIPPDVEASSIAAISHAWDIYTCPDRKTTRDLLEACLYTPLTEVEIGERIRIAPDVVEWYRFLYYDIRDYLAYPSFIGACEAFLGRLDSPEGAADCALQLKAVAHSRGADALFRMASGSESMIDEDWDWISRKIRQRTAIAAWRAARSIRPTNENAVLLGGLALKFQGMDEAVRKRGRGTR